MPPNNPLDIAEKSMRMGKESGDRSFRLVALVMMAATGMGVLMQAAHSIWRDLREERRYRRANGRAYPADDLPERVASNNAEMTSRQEEPAAERRWTGKPGLARRAPEAGQQRSVDSDTVAQARQR